VKYSEFTTENVWKSTWSGAGSDIAFTRANVLFTNTSSGPSAASSTSAFAPYAGETHVHVANDFVF
jgi:hypothetical protein